LILLCSDHHRALHEGAFTIQAHGKQQFTFHSPSGDRYETSPPLRGSLSGVTATYAAMNPESVAPDLDGNPRHSAERSRRVRSSHISSASAGSGPQVSRV
jgi:hypothetical protein